MSRFAPLLALAALAAILVGCGSPNAHPAATVNGHDISMSSYHQELKYECVNANSQYGFDVCKNKGTPYLTNPIKKTALETLIDRELIDEYAARHGISISDSTFKRYWRTVYQSKFGSDPRQLNTFATRTYGISVTTLKNRIRQDLLRQRVAAYVSRSMPTRTAAIRLARLETTTKGEATRVRAQLGAGSTFSQVAAQMQKNPSSPCKSGCGDLGWIPTAFLPSYETSLGSAKVGKIIGPIRLQKGGYEFYEVEARDSRYPMTQAQISTMTNQVVFPRWLGQQAKKASVKRYAVT